MAGNVLHVHDLVDFVSLEGERLAMQVAKYIKGEKLAPCEIKLNKDSNIGHTIPQKISGDAGLYFIYESKKAFKKCSN